MNDDPDQPSNLPAVTKTRDPAELGWPPALPVELALCESSPEFLRDYYGWDEDEWDRLMSDPGFLAIVNELREQLKKEGVSFRLKARLQAEEALKESWRMIHDPSVPANVRADLLKATWRVAGYEPKQGGEGQSAPTFAIQIVL